MWAELEHDQLVGRESQLHSFCQKLDRQREAKLPASSQHQIPDIFGGLCRGLSGGVLGGLLGAFDRFFVVPLGFAGVGGVRADFWNWFGAGLRTLKFGDKGVGFGLLVRTVVFLGRLCVVRSWFPISRLINPTPDLARELVEPQVSR